MNRSDDEASAVEKETGKRKIGEVKPKQSIGNYLRFPVTAVDSFGAINVLSVDKFGALRGLEGSGPNVYRRVEITEGSSTGSFTPLVYSSQGDKENQGIDTTPSANDSTWSTYIEDFENEGTSFCPSISQGFQNRSSHSSIPLSCTLHERTSTSSAASPALKRFCPPSKQNVHEAQVQPDASKKEIVDLRIAEHNDSEEGVTARSLPTAQSRYSVDPTRIATVRSGITLAAPASLDEVSRFSSMGPGRFGDARHSRDASDQYPVRFNYRFASAGLEASLLQRTEARQRVQDEIHEAERCGHVISPEDLVWGSVKHYCGMVLDRETRVLLGSAVLFISPEPAREGSDSSEVPKSAWVTCVKAVEGRIEVLIKNSRGAIHVAQLILTSTALGLALFNVNVWQGTFALAFLSRVTGPASLPHRHFVNVNRNDRVYVVGYEEPWESESAMMADARVRPGRVIDAGRHTIVEIDFTTGRLGGSINSPAGFRGGLVVRADGLWAGLVTGQVLATHRTSIDFSPAFNVYSLLAEL